MATDKSEPRTGLIFGMAILVVTILLSIRAGLITYFDEAVTTEEHRKYGEIKPEALINLRADEKRRLTAGPLPIATAMAAMVAHGREVSPEIAPTESRDLGPLEGWAKLPEVVPPAMVAATSAPDAGTAGADAAVAPSAVDAGVKAPAARRKKSVPKGQP